MKEYYDSDTFAYFDLTIVKYPANITEDDFDDEIVSAMKSLDIDTDPESVDYGTVFAIEETCENLVRLDDITAFAKDLARKYPDSVFHLKGTIDNTLTESPCLDFEIEYDGKHKLTVRTSDWYFVIDSDDAQVNSVIGYYPYESLEDAFEDMGWPLFVLDKDLPGELVNDFPFSNIEEITIE